ncbi:LuxR C-terminal-related transcriptional regulator [Actinoplanes sp. NPDC051633]|uniref:response regulator transcription factor n=1 Tax=Actinoplanes sp. NPDC051633 TaxID=3155670 RepID=UPI00342D5575
MIEQGRAWFEQAAQSVVKLHFDTDRELEVLRAARSGDSVHEIAAQVHLASGTVRNYLSTAMTKLGVNSRHAAAHRAGRRLDMGKYSRWSTAEWIQGTRRSLSTAEAHSDMSPSQRGTSSGPLVARSLTRIEPQVAFMVCAAWDSPAAQRSRRG